MPLKSVALPILGIATLVTDNYKELALNIKEINDKLKKYKGFGSMSLGYAIRSMISTSLVCSTYIQDISDINNTFTETTKNTVINIIIAMQIATTVAVTTAVVVAGASSS